MWRRVVWAGEKLLTGGSKDLRLAFWRGGSKICQPELDLDTKWGNWTDGPKLKVIRRVKKISIRTLLVIKAMSQLLCVADLRHIMFLLVLL